MKTRTKEKGIALMLALILVFVMSVMAVSLMFVSQTETWSSLNYRLTSQARDGAEAGLNSAANFLVNTYTVPGQAGDPTTAYNTTVSPVQYPSNIHKGDDVILSAMSGVSSNYPVSSVKSAYNSNGAGYGSFTDGTTTVNYSTYAKLLSMHTSFKSLGDPTTKLTVQTWQIVSDGTISGIKPAKVEVSAILEQHILPTFNYSVFANNGGCNALTFGGGGTTNSYDSSTYSGSGTPTFSSTNGDIGTNGSLTTGGSGTTINGDLFTPKTGVGPCSSGNVTAWQKNNGKVTGSLVQLPQTMSYPNPTIPAYGSPDISLSSANCPNGANAVPGCLDNGSTHDIYIPPGNYGNISFSGQVNLHFSPGVYNINSLQESGANTTVMIDDKAPTSSPWASYPSTATSGAVVVNVSGSSADPFTGNVVDLTGNGFQNPSLVAFNFQIQYAGTGTIAVRGGSQAAAVIYAPNASASFTGNADFYGAAIVGQMTDMGGTKIHYDRHLNDKSYIVGPWMLDEFTWKKD